MDFDADLIVRRLEQLIGKTAASFFADVGARAWRDAAKDVPQTAYKGPIRCRPGEKLGGTEVPSDCRKSPWGTRVEMMVSPVPKCEGPWAPSFIYCGFAILTKGPGLKPNSVYGLYS